MPPISNFIKKKGKSGKSEVRKTTYVPKNNQNPIQTVKQIAILRLEPQVPC